MDSRDNHKEEDLPTTDKLDLTAPEFIHDPYPIYKQLRLNSPVTPVQSGGYLLVRHADIVKVLKNSAFGNAPSRFSTLHAKKKTNIRQPTWQPISCLLWIHLSMISRAG